MPDWSYLTVGQPVLFRLPPRLARKTVLGMLGTTSSLPFGGQIIDLLGHMRPAGEEEEQFGNSEFALDGPVCMASCIDPDLEAIRAFERFGFGCLLVGPFREHEKTEAVDLKRNDDELSISVAKQESTLSVEEARRRLAARRVPSVKAILQCQYTTDVGLIRQQLAELGDTIDAVVISVDCASELAGESIPKLVHVRASEVANLDVANLLDKGIVGFYLDGSREEKEHGALTYGPANLQTTTKAASQLRKKIGADPFMLASGGVHQPVDAVELLGAGANSISLEAGFVFGGPGMAKRINEAVRGLRESAPAKPRRQVTRSSWFWTTLMGTAMVLGGCLATAIALTRVMLPYDESLLGMTRFELALVNDKLLDFMKHDRITLAGTMLSVGSLYVALSWNAIRRGSHWASVAIFVSAFVGFASFFLFLGFGYFDPFHAFVTAILFQFLLMGVFSHDESATGQHYVDLHNDRSWRSALWGQLLFILHGATLIGAGAVICSIGITSVFVAEDMEFLCTTRDQLLNANPHLVPLVAHDRATFGGMLISIGIVVSLTSLWGFRRGAKWLWGTLLYCCLIPYVMTLWIHHSVGYVDLKHLLPAYAGVIALLVGSWLTRSYLLDSSAADRGAQKKPAKVAGQVKALPS